MQGWTAPGVREGLLPLRDVEWGEENSVEEMATGWMNPRLSNQRTRPDGGHVSREVIQDLIDEILGDPGVTSESLGRSCEPGRCTPHVLWAPRERFHIRDSGEKSHGTNLKGQGGGGWVREQLLHQRGMAVDDLDHHP
jgi:hypothetical protein